MDRAEEEATLGCLSQFSWVYIKRTAPCLETRRGTKERPRNPLSSQHSCHLDLYCTPQKTPPSIPAVKLSGRHNASTYPA